jgi:HEAT repeat-containing protein 5
MLTRAIRHPHQAVQAAASWCLRSFVLAVPAQIESLLQSCKSALRELMDKLSDGSTPNGRVAIGVAQGLAVFVQVCPYRPLYFSGDAVLEVWSLANSLLQMAAKSDLRTSQIQIHVAWNLIGALMAADVNFVKPRMNQLFLLWQNALPRPFPKDSMSARSIPELQYLLHVRERALAALYLFLHYNSRWITHDTSKRIVTMLSDTGVFVGRLPAAPVTDDTRIVSLHSQLLEMAIKVKMRVMKCFSILANGDIRNLAGPELLMTAISVFVESEPFMSRSMAGKQTAASSLESLSSSTDNYAYGLSSYVKRLSIPEPTIDFNPCRHWSVWDSDGEVLERMV